MSWRDAFTDLKWLGCRRRTAESRRVHQIVLDIQTDRNRVHLAGREQHPDVGYARNEA